MARRGMFSSLLFASAALGSIATPAIVSAQDTGSTVTVYFATCTWTGSLPGLVFDTDAGTSDTARDCVDGWSANGVELLLNDVPPDSQDSYAAVWNDVADGESILLGYNNIPNEEVRGFEVDGEDVALWATFYNFEHGDDTGSTNGSSATSTATTATTAAEVTALPNTGSGNNAASQANLLPEALAIIFVAMSGFAARIIRR